MNEFELIDHFFKSKTSRHDVALGIGDDAALLSPPNDTLLAASMDTLVAGIHFPDGTQPELIGHKSLAVNLSDLAAMGAEPAWAMLALTLPKADEKWLAGFAKGFFNLAQQYQVQLIGGDTTHGPLSITVQVQGFVPQGKALKRSGAKPGDKIYVSGTLGDAGTGLQLAEFKKYLSETEQQFVLHRLNSPMPRIALGVALRDVATSAIDISDGLLADLGHILKASKSGAVIHADKIPLSTALSKLPAAEAVSFALTAGDDYELCFTIPYTQESRILPIIQATGVVCTCIGEITNLPGLRIEGQTGRLNQSGYQHF
jgi:thiamine-monophosphate kinase